MIQQIIDLLSEISDTDLPEYLKSFLNEKLNEILEVAESYSPNKAQELSKTSRNAMFEFASWQEVIEKRFREHPVVIRFVKIAGGVLLVSQLIGGDTTSNIVGTIADGITIYSQFSSKSELAEEIYIKNDFNIKGIIEEVSTQTADKLKTLTGTEEPKALPPADEESADYRVINEEDEDFTETETNED